MMNEWIIDQAEALRNHEHAQEEEGGIKQEDDGARNECV